MSEAYRDSIEKFHDYGICLETKTMDISEEITQEYSIQVIKNLHLLDNSPKQGDVSIILSCEGGDVYSGLAIYDAIRNMKSDVYIFAYGEVSSMATVIFQAADHRYISKNSFLMIHEGSGHDAAGSEKSREAWRKIDKILEDACNQIYWDKVKQKKKCVKKNLINQWRDDTIYTAKEALEWGLVDEIIEGAY